MTESIFRTTPEAYFFDKVSLWPEIWQLCQQATEQDNQLRSKIPPYNEQDLKNLQQQHLQDISPYLDTARSAVNAFMAKYPKLVPMPEASIQKYASSLAIDAANNEYFAPYEQVSIPIINGLLEKLQQYPVWDHIFSTGYLNHAGSGETPDKFNSLYLMTAKGTLRIKLTKLRQYGLEKVIQTPIEQTFFVKDSWVIRLGSQNIGVQSKLHIPPEALLVPQVGYSTDEYSSQAFEQFIKGDITYQQYLQQSMIVDATPNGTDITWRSEYAGNHFGHPVKEIHPQIPLIPQSLPPHISNPFDNPASRASFRRFISKMAE